MLAKIGYETQIHLVKKKMYLSFTFFDMTIGERIDHEIKRQGLKYAAIAGALGISVQYLNRIRKGTAPNVSDRIYRLLAHELQVQYNWLMTGEGEMFFPEPKPLPSPIDIEAKIIASSPKEDPDYETIRDDYRSLTTEQKWYIRALIDIFKVADKDTMDAIKPNIVQFTLTGGHTKVREKLKAFKGEGTTAVAEAQQKRKAALYVKDDHHESK